MKKLIMVYQDLSQKIQKMYFDTIRGKIKQYDDWLTKFNMFKKKNILVIGDIMLDKYSHGSVSRISEAPVPIVDIKKTIFKPGGASNVAQNLSSLGMNVTLIGITGDDPELRTYKSYATY